MTAPTTQSEANLAAIINTVAGAFSISYEEAAALVQGEDWTDFNDKEDAAAHKASLLPEVAKLSIPYGPAWIYGASPGGGSPGGGSPGASV